MIHCKNWFCARSNNNDYAEVLFGDTKTTTQTTSATDTMATAAATANNARQQQPANGKIGSGIGIGSSAGTGTTMGNNVAQSVTHNNTTAQSSATGTAVLPTSGNATTTGTGGGGGSNSCSVTASGLTGTGSHVVTFLDDVPSGSNGVVNTTTRLMNNTDLQQQYDHHTSDDLEALDTEEFLANNIVSSAMLCDDTLPTSKNCYRLVILG